MKHAAGNTPKTCRKRFERASKAHFQYISERIRTRSKPKRFRTSSSGQAAFQKHSEQTKRSRYRWRRPSRINRGWHDTPNKTVASGLAASMVAEQTAQRTHAETEPSTPKPSGKGGGLRRTPFPMGFAVGGGRLSPKN